LHAFLQPLEEIRTGLVAAGRWQGELTHTNRDGHKITVLSQWVRESGERAGYVLETNFDLTERNRALALEKANELKSEFLASVSHELRSTLHTIIGFSELLGEQLVGPLNEKQQRFVDHIHKDSVHLLDLINDLLDLSKIEAGKLTLHREAFDVRDAVQDATNTVAPAGKAKNVSIDVVPGPTLSVYADRLRVRQILVNLVTNAVKFTPAGGTVRIETAEEDQFAQLSVLDSGIGIPKEEQKAILPSFIRSARPAKKARALAWALPLQGIWSSSTAVPFESKASLATAVGLYLRCLWTP
jgi:signal transduction histidine kinase